MNKMVFNNLQEAWEKINIFLANGEEKILKMGGGRNGPSLMCYDNYIEIRRAWIDPEFDFGTKLGYKKHKWSGLLNNYVDFNYLDLVKSETLLRETKKARSYNHTLHFSNSHDSGKDCLISLTFTRRLFIDHPIVIFTVRNSEVTKRLLLDFLLIQRLCEYVYGEKAEVGVIFIAPCFYITAENFVMFNNHRKIKKIIKKQKPEDYGHHILKVYEQLMNADLKKLTYGSLNRSARVLQKKDDAGPMLARDLKLIKGDPMEYPHDCVSQKERRAYRKKLRHEK